MNIVIEKILKVMAKMILWRRGPKIIIFAGDQGCDAQASAVFAVLSSKFSVRQNQKKHAGKIDIPLAIIGAQCEQKNLIKCLLIFFKWIGGITFAKYPEILMLNLAIEEKGCAQFLASLSSPDVVILENAGREKRIIVESLSRGGIVILGNDDELAKKICENAKVQTLTHGQTEGANVSASHAVCNFSDGQPGGISFKLDYEGTNIPIRLKNIFDEQLVGAALIGIAAGIAFKINLVDIASSLEYFQNSSDFELK